MASTNSTVDDSAAYVLAVNFQSIRLTDEQFYRLCHDNPELRMELTAKGGLVVMSPTGAKTGWRNSKLNQRLANWADKISSNRSFTRHPGKTLPGQDLSRLTLWPAHTPGVRLCSSSLPSSTSTAISRISAARSRSHSASSRTRRR